VAGRPDGGAMPIEERLVTLGLRLPPPHRFPNVNRRGCVAAGGLLFVSGHPPLADGGLRVHGKVPTEVSEEEAYRAARTAALNMLSSIKDHVGTLDRVAAVVKIFGMVNSAPGFNRQFAVIDGASDLFLELWGSEKGRHARSAVGMYELPRDIAVEVEGIFELTP
jgi:enamine deaminase RidA (YjgF/YER057c/UK114 family)